MGADGDADAGLPATAPGTPAGWRLVFQDDFSGSAVDTTQWGMYDSPGHDGNGLRTEPDPSGATSGVVLTWPQNGNWPADGENDIYETGTGTSRASFSTFIHYGADNRQYHDKHAVDATQWHIVAMEWEANALRIYRDGALVWTLTDANAIPDVAHHLCIQLDAFRTIMGDPVKMYVDWAKIYQR